MGDTTKISWSDSTFNPWIGCTKVSEGCRNCYAETLVRRYQWTKWGPEGERVRTSVGNWRKPRGWNREAAAAGVRRRVFCASLADIFDERAPEGARADLWQLIRETPSLDWQILTKRPERIAAELPPDWPLPNVWLGVSAENQETYDERWPVLLEVPAVVHFVSYEPAVGSLDIRQTEAARVGCGRAGVPQWIIIGGESGNGARVMTPAWARHLVSQCRALGVAVFLKQWGTYRSNPFVVERGLSRAEAERRDPKTNGKGGALLDGLLYREFPEVA